MERLVQNAIECVLDNILDSKIAVLHKTCLVSCLIPSLYENGYIFYRTGTIIT